MFGGIYKILRFKNNAGRKKYFQWFLGKTDTVFVIEHPKKAAFKTMVGTAGGVVFGIKTSLEITNWLQRLVKVSVMV